jgi:cytochrome c-type biogenesis protein
MGWLEAVVGALSQPTLLAPVAALVWGGASVVLSPCHLTSIPVSVTFLVRRTEGVSPWRVSLFFTLGVLVSLALVGGVTVAAGRIAGDLWGLGSWLAAALLLLAGLHLLGVFQLPAWGRGVDARRVPRGRAGGLVLGLALGTTLGPCTFAFLAPVLALSLGGGGVVAWTGLTAFVVGHAVATFVVGGLGLRVARWLESGARVTRVAKVLAGSAAVAAGLFVIATAP